jgi:hypothetical protein
VVPALVDNLGNIIEGAAEGNLVILDSWPGQARTLYGDHDRFVDTYFKTFRGMYFTGDGARRDEDGYYWITGRVDDVLNVSGHRMGTAEIESAMVAHPKVAEAAVVGVPHDIKGQGIYVYVTLNAGEEPSEQLRLELKNWVRKEIGPIASPDVIQWAPGLPKTRSGKIMRRILRKIATGEYDAWAISPPWPTRRGAAPDRYPQGDEPGFGLMARPRAAPTGGCRHQRTPPGQPAGFLLYCYPTFIGNLLSPISHRIGAQETIRAIAVRISSHFVHRGTLHLP